MRYNPTDVTSTYAAIAALNSNFSDIQALFEKCVFTDGETPNSMEAVLDMNHFTINNVGVPVNSNDAVRLLDLQNATLSGYVTPEAYGAVGNGTTDDSAAIQAAINTGKRVQFKPQTTYAIASTLNLGNGTPTTLSLLNGIVLQGTTSGAAASEFGPAVRPTCIKWIGAAHGTMVNVNGPIVGVNVQGIFFDGNNLADTITYFKHMLASTWQDVVWARYTGTAVIAEAYASVGGVFVNGSQKCTMINCRAKNPGTGGSGLRLGVTSGFVNGMLDVAQWDFINCEFYRDGTTSTTFSAQLSFCDNLTFHETTFASQNGSSGKCVYILPPTGTGNFARFPHEVSFFNCPIFTGFTVDAAWAPTTGGVFCMPYPTSDGEPIPSSPYIVGMDFTGRWFGPQSYSLPTAVIPANNGDYVIQKTSDTLLTFKVKGSDGVIRTNTLTLS